MKKYVYGMMLCSMLAACQPDNVCIIEGHVQEVEDGTELYLMRKRPNGLSYGITDTTIIKDGKFILKITYIDKEMEPEKVTLLQDDRKKRRFGMLGDFYIAPGEKVRITGKGDEVYAWQVESKIPHQQYFNQLTAKSRPYIIEVERLYALSNVEFIRHSRVKAEEYDKTKQLIDSVVATNYPPMFAYRDSVVLTEIEAMKRLEINKIWVKRLQEHCGTIELSKHFAHGGKEYPSYVANLQNLYERLTPGQRATKEGKKIANYLYPLKGVEAGDTLYDAILYDLQGNRHHLADYRGKYLLIDFWRASCGPCRKSISEMRRLAKEWKEVLHIISISNDDKENWRKVSQQENITWTNLNDLQGTTDIFAHYGVVGVPHYVIVSPESKILHTWAGYGTGLIEKKLKEWIQK